MTREVTFVLLAVALTFLYQHLGPRPIVRNAATGLLGPWMVGIGFALGLVDSHPVTRWVGLGAALLVHAAFAWLGRRTRASGDAIAE